MSSGALNTLKKRLLYALKRNKRYYGTHMPSVLGSIRNVDSFILAAAFVGIGLTITTDEQGSATASPTATNVRDSANFFGRSVRLRPRLRGQGCVRGL